MTLDELKTEIGKDAVIDRRKLDVESLNIAYITSKYLNYRTQENLVVRALTQKYNTLHKTKWEYYSGKSTPPFPLKILKQDLSIYLDSDNELSAIQAKIDIRKEKVKLIDSFIQIMNQRSFNISNAIKWQEFTAGK